MNAEIKNVKIARFASEETTCFEATLYLDGKRAASVSNSGQGGPNMFWWHDRKAEAAFHAHVATLPNVPSRYFPEGLTMSPDLFVDLLLEEYETQKQYRTWCRKKTVFRLIGDTPETYRNLNLPYGPRALAYLAKYEGRIEEILNETIGQAPATA